MSWTAIDLAVGVAGRAATFHTNGPQLYNFVSSAHEAWHGAKGTASKILIKSGTNDFHPFIGQPYAQLNNAVVEELHFFDANNFCISRDGSRKFINSTDSNGFVSDPHVGDHHAFVVAAVDFWFKDADSLFGIEGSSGSPDQFF